MRPGIFLDTGFRDGRFNMKMDEDLLFQMEREGLPPILRVYGWEPPAVSVGYFQKPSEVVDLRKCRKFGVEVVKRPTGGRAILHLDDFTYSFIGLTEDGGGSRGLTGAYLLISQALVEGLRILGVNVRLERGKAKAHPHLRGRPCFASVSRYEIKARGGKLVGSAQRRLKKAVLQHGSIPLGRGRFSIADLLPASLGGGWGTNLSDSLGRAVEFAEVRRAIKEGFEITFKREFVPCPWEEFAPSGNLKMEPRGEEGNLISI